MEASSTPNHAALMATVHRWVQPTPAEWAAALPLLRWDSFPKQHVLVEAGQETDRLYFLLSGIVRHYFVDPVAGDAGTVWFSFAGDWVNDAYGFPTQQPALTNVLSVTPVQVAWLTRTDRDRLFASAPVWERLGRLAAEDYLVRQMRHSWAFYFRTAKERYESLFAERPELFQWTPLNQIASFLGVTPETLSRLRA